jgi:hypothetical protein
VRSLIVLAGVAAAGVTAANAVEACKNAGVEYTEGATICECPTVKGEAGHATGGPMGSVTSRRLVCKAGSWQFAGTNCAEVTAGAGYIFAEHKKFQEMYCPRPGFAEQANGYIERALPSQGLAILSPLCRRFAISPQVCAAAIEAISASK